MPPPISSSQAVDPDMRVSLQVDNDSQLPRLLEGQTVAVLGRPLDNLTAEAHEQNRKLKLHNQLVRARRLRAIIEDAASRADALSEDSPSSYSQAMAILESTIPHINELVRLTEALRGNYTCEDVEYDEWNKWMKMKDDMDEMQFMRDQKILRQQLRELGKETNPDFEMDDELEQRHEALILNPEEDPVKYLDESDMLDDQEGGEKLSSERTKKKNTASLKDNLGQSTTQLDGRKQKSLKTNNIQHQKGEELAPREAAMKKPAPPEKNETQLPSVEQKPAMKRPPLDTKSSPIQKKTKRRRTQRKDPPELSLPKPSIGTITKAAQLVASGASSRPVKKCHDCKKSTNLYRQCNFWQITGKKCGKCYCKNCLETKYTMGNDILGDNKPNGVSIDDILQTGKHDSEWHCPSCLKTCQCAQCIKQRQREEERERSRDQGDRRSNRRSTERPDYTNFFQVNGGGVLF